jgi:hypothetical protein
MVYEKAARKMLVKLTAWNVVVVKVKKKGHENKLSTYFLKLTRKKVMKKKFAQMKLCQEFNKISS